uniref:Uncharacterized protein n=1 Tax=Fibrocapsa japonica TaxID=94617 RepID=A0A7S2XVF4_9STRA
MPPKAIQIQLVLHHSSQRCMVDASPRPHQPEESTPLPSIPWINKNGAPAEGSVDLLRPQSPNAAELPQQLSWGTGVGCGCQALPLHPRQRAKAWPEYSAPSPASTTGPALRGPTLR